MSTMEANKMKMSKAKWSAEKTWKFVMEYRLRECLWNTKKSSYKDRPLKDTAYLELAKMFNCGVNDVKIKIKNLRTTYIQEHKKVVESMKTNDKDEVYVPSLVWYNEMDSFLRYTSVEKAAPAQALVPSPNKPDIEAIEIKEECVETTAIEHIDNPEIKDYEPRQSREFLEYLAKKRKQVECLNVQQMDVTSLSDITEEHEFDIFGKSVAKQLKSFSSIAAALRVQSRIQTLLTEERIRDQIAATDANSRRHHSENKRFFYDCSVPTTQLVSIVLPSSTQQMSSLSNYSCEPASIMADGKDLKEFEVTFMN